MRTPPRRLASCLVALASGLLLSGCGVTGTITLTGSREVTVDLVARDVDPVNSGCEAVGAPFKGSLTRTGNGVWLCEVTGTGPAAALESVLVRATWVDEYASLVFNPGYLDETGPNADSLGIGSLDVTVRMPGLITETTGGERTGFDSVRFADPTRIGKPGGFTVVSLNHPGPPRSVWYALAGASGGAALASLGWWRRGRRRAHAPTATTEASQAHASVLTAATSREPVDPAAPGLDATAPGTRDQASAPRDEPDETAFWSGRGPAGPMRRTDASVWAPPGDPET